MEHFSMEFRGAIHTEVDAYNGTTALLDAEGLLPDRESIEDDVTLENFFQRRQIARVVKALWCAHGDYSWTFETDIPHATFEITEDGEPYCRGIVISLDELGS
jgi:hypothetical protein